MTKNKSGKLYALCSAAIGAVYISGYAMTDPTFTKAAIEKQLLNQTPVASVLSTLMPATDSPAEPAGPTPSPTDQPAPTPVPTTQPTSTPAQSAVSSPTPGKTALHNVQQAASASPKPAEKPAAVRKQPDQVKPVITYSLKPSPTPSPTPVASATASPTPAATPKPSPSVQPAAQPVVQAKKYRDGAFYGESSDWNGLVGVSVSIKNDKIVAVKISKCTTSYPEYVISDLPSQVVSNQSYQIDAVSGATVSSDEFMMAVREALKKAKVPT